MSPKFHTLKVAAISRETEDAVAITFDVPTELQKEYDFEAGQYLTLKTVIGGEEIRRSYSLCSAPADKQWTVAVKKVEDGRFSTYANEQLQVGDSLDVMTPMGGFILKDKSQDQQTHYVMYAAGSGITPMLSLMKTILEEQSNSTVSLFYGNKNFKSILFKEEIEALKNIYLNRLRITHVLSRESLGNDLQKGRIDKERCARLNKAFLSNESIDQVYICGPEEMIFAVKEYYEEQGFKKEQIHFELFTSSAPKKAPAAPANEPKIDANVKIILDGDELEIALESNGINILDAAQESGADLPFACKGGVCCTCKAKVVEGSVRMDVNYALEPDEVAAGYILTCQSHPTSEKLTVTFDE